MATEATGKLVVMAMDLMGKDKGMGTVLSLVTAERMGISQDEFLAMSVKDVRSEMDTTRVLVFGDDEDPTPAQVSG